MNEIMQFLSTTAGMVTVGAILLVLLFAGIGVGKWKRGRELPPGPTRTELPVPDQVIPDTTEPSGAQLPPPTVTEADLPEPAEDVTVAKPAAPALDEPESRVGRMQRLRARLAGSG